MTDYGVTPEGFRKKSFNVLLEGLETAERTSLGAPDLDIKNPAGFLASVLLPVVDLAAELWDLGEAVYNAPDPQRSTGQAFAVVGALRGVARKPAETGKCISVTHFSAPVAGAVYRGDVRVHPAGEPENIWINQEDFTVVLPGAKILTLESEIPGSSKVLEPGDTIVVLEGPSEISLINIADSSPGTDLEDLNTWRDRATEAGSDTASKVEAFVEDVTGVAGARVIETPGYIQTVVNDDGASDNEIAQAIYDSKAQGVQTIGAESGTALNSKSEEVTQNFDRVVRVRCYISVAIFAPNGYSATDLKNALLLEAPTASGKDAIWSKFFAAASGVLGVTDISSLGLGTSASPTGTVNLTASDLQLLEFAADDIEISVVS